MCPRGAKTGVTRFAKCVLHSKFHVTCSAWRGFPRCESIGFKKRVNYSYTFLMNATSVIAQSFQCIRRRCAVCGVLVLSLFVLGGCLVRVAYNNADTIIRWELNRYFDLEAEQERLLDARLPDHLDWHRTQELPRAINFLVRARTALDDGISDAELSGLFDDFSGLNQALVARLLGDGTALLAQLDAEQIEYLQRKLARANKDWEERLQLPPDQRREERIDRILKQVEDWIGDVDDPQRDALIVAVDRIPDVLDVWLTHRKSRQRRFVELVRLARTDRAAARTGLQQYFSEPMPAVLIEHRNAVRAFILDVDRLATAKHRAHAQQRLQKWIDDLEIVTKTKT